MYSSCNTWTSSSQRLNNSLKVTQFRVTLALKQDFSCLGFNSGHFGPHSGSATRTSETGARARGLFARRSPEPAFWAASLSGCLKHPGGIVFPDTRARTSGERMTYMLCTGSALWRKRASRSADGHQLWYLRGERSGRRVRAALACGCCHDDPGGPGGQPRPAVQVGH